MEQLIILVSMVTVGALIGGFTNFLAITMLFRPHRTLYIGNWKLPFTPGLIPKRKEELAIQLGRLVSTQLVTAEVLSEKLFHPSFKEELTGSIINWINDWLDQSHRVIDIVEAVWGKAGVDRLTELEAKLVSYGEQELQRLGRRSASDLLPATLLAKVEGEAIPAASDFLLRRFVQYLDSRDGEETLSHLVNHFLQERGSWFRFVIPFLPREERIVHFIQGELVQLSTQPAVRNAVIKLLREEFQRGINTPIEEIGGELFKRVDETSQPKQGVNTTPHNEQSSTWLHTLVQELIRNVIPLEKWIYQPLHQAIGTGGRHFIDQTVTRLIDQALKWLNAHLGALLEKLELDRLVTNHVQRFPVEKVEALVLDIARRELRMITFLGAGLGGGIGLAQGILVLFLN